MHAVATKRVFIGDDPHAEPLDQSYKGLRLPLVDVVLEPESAANVQIGSPGSVNGIGCRHQQSETAFLERRCVKQKHLRHPSATVSILGILYVVSLNSFFADTIIET